MVKDYSVIRYLFENSLPGAPSSCEGEPAPDRVVPVIFPAEVKPPGLPNGDLAGPLPGSVGELLVVDDVDRDCNMTGGMYPNVG